MGYLLCTLEKNQVFPVKWEGLFENRFLIGMNFLRIFKYFENIYITFIIKK